MRIGLDIDGVMYQWSRTARKILRDELPNDLGVEPVYTQEGPLGRESDNWDYISQNVDPEHWKWLWDRGVSEYGLFRYGFYYKDTPQAIRKLADYGDIILITHRPKTAVKDTLDWITYFFRPLPLHGVHLLTSQEPKSGVKPECDIYLDDKPENIDDLAENTSAKCVALMDREWNQHYKMPWTPCENGRSPIIRVKSWDQFIRAARIVSEEVK